MRSNPVPDNVVLFITIEFPDPEFWFGPGDAILANGDTSDLSMSNEFPFCLLYTSPSPRD